MLLTNINIINLQDFKPVAEVAKIKKVSVQAVHKAMNQDRLDYIRQGFNYLVYVNNSKFQYFGK